MFIIKVTGKQKICAIILEQASSGKSKVQTASIIMPSCSIVINLQKMCQFIFLVAVMLNSLDINPSEKVPIPHGKTLFALSRRRPITISSGIVPAHMSETGETVDELKEKLKSAVKAFYVDQDLSAIQRIEQLSAKIGQLVLSSET